MKRTIVSLVTLTALTLAGCSSYKERVTASGQYKYLQAPPPKHLEVPEGIDTPNYSRAYELPELGENAPRDAIGENLVILSPALVLPVVTGSHIEDGSQTATVWFDQVDDSQPLDTAVWNSLISYLEEQGIAVDSFDKNEQTLVTDWLVIKEEVDSKWYSWNSTERKIGKRFEFDLEVKPHGRSAALNANLVDYMETVNDEVVDQLGAGEQRRSEVEILNNVISHYEYQIRVADSKRIRLIRSGFDMSLGFDPDGHPAFLVDAGYDIVWPRYLLVLRNLGFNVKDLDKSDGLLFVQYTGTEDSWWSNLWGNDEELKLDNKEYRIQMSPVGEKTTITMMDEENTPFSANRVTDLFDAFARVMREDNLDIK